jgi:hypothetical protein
LTGLFDVSIALIVRFGVFAIALAKGVTTEVTAKSSADIAAISPVLDRILYRLWQLNKTKREKCRYRLSQKSALFTDRR